MYPVRYLSSSGRYAPSAWCGISPAALAWHHGPGDDVVIAHGYCPLLDPSTDADVPPSDPSPEVEGPLLDPSLEVDEPPLDPSPPEVEVPPLDEPDVVSPLPPEVWPDPPLVSPFDVC